MRGGSFTRMEQGFVMPSTVGAYDESLYFFFYCIAELAIKPCRSSRSNTRGGFEKFDDTCKKGNKTHAQERSIPVGRSCLPI